MDNLHIYNRVRSVPDTACRKISAGRLNGKTDINPMWRIKTLTEQFGPCGIGWYYDVDRQWTETHGDEVAAFVNIRLYINVSGEWSKPIFGTGGSMFAEVQRSGTHVSDECYKMATTDAISVACKQLGIGADVYWDADASKYTSCVETDREENSKNETTQEDDVPDEIKKRFAEVDAELRRTGYAAKSICMTYKLNSVYEMSNLQIKDFLAKIKKMPDKEAR